MESNFDTINKTRGKLPSLPLVLMKEGILGKSYYLSLAFVGEKKSRELNKQYRGKDNATNILSFVFSKSEGEIMMCLPVLKRESKVKSKNRGKNFHK